MGLLPAAWLSWSAEDAGPDRSPLANDRCGLEQQMRAGRITRLEDARQYLQRAHNIHYASVNGVWRLLRQRRVKFKTGRRRHRQADAGAQAAFKKTLDAC